MTVLTVVGMVADELGHQKRETLTSTPYGVELRTSFTAMPAFEYRRAQPSRIPLDVDHDGREIGAVHFLERNAAGALWMVGTVDDLGLLRLREAPWLSPSVTANPDGTDIELRSVALTFDPATYGLRRVHIALGDFRDSNFQRSWTYQTPMREIMQRAASYAEHRHGSRPLLVNASPDAYQRVEDQDGNHAGFVDDLGDLVPRSSRGMGPMEYRPCGPILAIR